MAGYILGGLPAREQSLIQVVTRLIVDKLC